MLNQSKPDYTGAAIDIFTRTQDLSRNHADPAERRAMMIAIHDVVSRMTDDSSEVARFLEKDPDTESIPLEGTSPGKVPPAEHNPWLTITITGVGRLRTGAFARINLLTEVLHGSVEFDGHFRFPPYGSFLFEKFAVIRALYAPQGRITRTIPQRSEDRFRDLDVEIFDRELRNNVLGSCLNIVAYRGDLLYALVSREDLSTSSYYVEFSVLEEPLRWFRTDRPWTISVVDSEAKRFLVLSDGIQFVAVRVMKAEATESEYECLPDLRARHLARAIHSGKSIAEVGPEDPATQPFLAAAVELEKKYRFYDVIADETIIAGDVPSPTFWDDYFEIHWNRTAEEEARRYIGG